MSTQVRLRHGRRRVLARQGDRGLLDRRAPRGARLQGHARRSSTPTSTSTPGRCRPFQHGEVYVTDDGAETDLDLGHYERFTSMTGSRDQQHDGGPDLPDRHRAGAARRLPRQDRPGHPPHHRRDQGLRSGSVGPDADVVIVEIGGTVGDIESLPFLEAIRQFRQEAGRGNAINVHLTLVPYIKASDELKTKPTQHSVKELLSIGIQPDVLLCRTDRALPEEVKQKIALFCNVPVEAVINAKDVPSIYEVPARSSRPRGSTRSCSTYLTLPHYDRDLSKWESLVNRIKNPAGEVDDRGRRQVRGLRRLLQVAERGARPRRHREQRAGQAPLRRRRDARERPVPRSRSSRADAILVPGRLRPPRHRGDDAGHPLRAREEGPVLRHLPRPAVARSSSTRGNVAGLEGANSTEFEEEPEAQGHLQAARPDRRRGARRDDAARQVPVRARPRLVRGARLRREPDLGAPPPPLRGQPGVPAGA